MDWNVFSSQTTSVKMVDIRFKCPDQLRLPKTPQNLSKMSREQLLKQYDRFADYWAVWLGKASMLPEIIDSYTDKQLRGVIEIASSDFARNGWKYHDYARFTDEHTEFYEEFFKRWDAVLGVVPKKRRNVSNRRSAKQRQNLLRTRQKLSRKKSKLSKSQRKSRSTRPSPSTSAAESTVGLVKVGNDGLQYVVKKDKRGVKRWHKLQ